MWAVVSVPSQTEFKFLKKVQEINIDGFISIGKRMTKPKRKHKSVVSTFKLFPGYVFVDIPFGFESLRFADLKMKFSFLHNADGDIAYIKQKVIDELRGRSNINDLFFDHDKKHMRSSFIKNQLVCWKKGEQYMLGFVSGSTRGKSIACVKIADGMELKISVANLSLLSL